MLGGENPESEKGAAVEESGKNERETEIYKVKCAQSETFPILRFDEETRTIFKWK